MGLILGWLTAEEGSMVWMQQRNAEHLEFIVITAARMLPVGPREGEGKGGLPRD